MTHTKVTPQAIHDVFVAYIGREPRSERWDQERLLPDVEQAIRQLLNPAGQVYNYINAGQNTDLDRTYRNDIRAAMRKAGFEGETD